MTKILVVDDSTISRKMTLHLVKNFDYETIEATGGQQALDIVSTQKPDLIILDLLMPDVDGFAVLQKLKNDGNSIPVLVLSADIQATTKTKCLDLGAAGFLNKPAQGQEIDRALKEALEGVA